MPPSFVLPRGTDFWMPVLRVWWTGQGDRV